MNYSELQQTTLGITLHIFGKQLMQLVIFDLDGTLLNDVSRISPFTSATLKKLTKKNIAYTFATGRTFDSAQGIIAGHQFILPQIYSNGVIIWNPENQTLSLDNCLSSQEARYIINTTLLQHITPFISAVNHKHQHFIFHPTVINAAEKKLLSLFQQRKHVSVLPIDQMSDDMQITNISMIGDTDEINRIQQQINTQPHLIAYSGPAIEGNGLKWMDIHHSEANKGSAIEQLRQKLSISHVVCFGDSDNDLSMFAVADESYATANAKEDIKEAATATIGYHHEDGVAHYLHERFDL